mgnify:CR=1 FL=1
MRIKFKDIKEKAHWVEMPGSDDWIKSVEGKERCSLINAAPYYKHIKALLNFIYDLLRGKDYRSIMIFDPTMTNHNMRLIENQDGEITIDNRQSLLVFANECYTRGAVYVRDEMEQAYDKFELHLEEDLKDEKHLSQIELGHLRKIIKALRNSLLAKHFDHMESIIDRTTVEYQKLHNNNSDRSFDAPNGFKTTDWEKWVYDRFGHLSDKKMSLEIGCSPTKARAIKKKYELNKSAMT